VQALAALSVLVAAGAAPFGALAVTGGTVAAVLLDHFGLLGFAQHDATLLRLAGRARMASAPLKGRGRSPPLPAPR
jgi:transporter family-2 protein